MTISQNINVKRETFGEKVLKIIKRIPRGSVLTYKQVAKKAGRPKAYRAVGNILNKNDSASWRTNGIPCHRVVRSDGKVGGYNRGPETKEILLKKEGVIYIK